MLAEIKKTKVQDEFVRYQTIYRQRLREYAGSFKRLSKYFDYNIKPESNWSREKIISFRDKNEDQRIIGDYLREIGDLVEDIAAEENKPIALEPKTSKLLSISLKEEKVNLIDAWYITNLNGRKGIALSLRTSRKNIDVNFISKIVSFVIGYNVCPYDNEDKIVTKDEGIYFFQKKPNFYAMPGFARATKEGEHISGDAFSFYDYEKDRLIAMLSDGTGSGEIAKEYSEQVINMMEDMIYSGYKEDVAARLINSYFLSMAGDDNHPTLDVCNIDLIDGMCKCLKVGGTATFVKNGFSVQKIYTSSLPLGIFRNIDTFDKEYDISSGDFVIMMSDGITDVYSKNNIGFELEEYLEEMKTVNSNEMAEQILRHAIYLNKGRIEDDMTVLVIGVWKMRDT